MKHFSFFLLLLLSLSVSAQTAKQLKQISLAKWNIGTGQYSGITPIGSNRYAVVSDKEPRDGFFIFQIDQNPQTGEITNASLEGFKGNPAARVDANGFSVRDPEGIAYLPQTGTLFISGEGDQEILEYALDGTLTGRRLQVPKAFSLRNIVPNYGFEALTHCEKAHLFWTTTESTLPADGFAASAAHPTAQNLLRLQSFDDTTLQPAAQYAYRMDTGRSTAFGRIYAYGVSELTALPDGRLLVLEREANVTAKGIKSEVVCKLYLVAPTPDLALTTTESLQQLPAARFLPKKLLASWRTQASPFNLTFANYEGMCLGRTLTDGRLSLILINDSQGGYHKGPFRLKDYLKVILLGE